MEYLKTERHFPILPGTPIVLHDCHARGCCWNFSARGRRSFL